MRLRFNEAKATQAAARLLHLKGGKMSYMKLIKLLYLIDREALLRWGRPVTGDTYVSMDKGPVLSGVLDLVTEGSAPGRESFWARYISEPQGYEVALKEDCPSDELSRAEEKLIEEVFQRYGQVDRWSLVEFVHELPEWKDPKGSAIPISYADILKAGGRSEKEIGAIESELEALAVTDLLLSPR